MLYSRIPFLKDFVKNVKPSYNDFIFEVQSTI